MCALDALAVSPMFGMQTQINSQCRVSSDPVHIVQSGKKIDNLNEVKDTQFGIAWGASNKHVCVADSLCMEMMFLRDTHVANQWLDEDPENRETFTLSEAVEFADQFFTPLMS
jgi:mercuric reductase